MNDLQIFTNPEFGQVRTVELDGTPWLVGKDVATALGYKNPGKAVLAHVDDEDKRLEILPQTADSQNGNVPGASKTAIINESGLYSLILSSKMPKAKAFKRWVTAEVLPAIRKNGVYQSVKAQQQLEEAVAKDENIQKAIDKVIAAKDCVKTNANLLAQWRKLRDDNKAQFLEWKAIYGQSCDSVRTMEQAVQDSQEGLNNAIDNLTIVAKGYPFYLSLLESLLADTPAEEVKKE